VAAKAVRVAGSPVKPLNQNWPSCANVEGMV
jgi:hypothetical protein